MIIGRVLRGHRTRLTSSVCLPTSRALVPSSRWDEVTEVQIRAARIVSHRTAQDGERRADRRPDGKRANPTLRSSSRGTAVAGHGDGPTMSARAMLAPTGRPARTLLGTTTRARHFAGPHHAAHAFDALHATAACLLHATPRFLEGADLRVGGRRGATNGDLCVSVLCQKKQARPTGQQAHTTFHKAHGSLLEMP